MYFSMHRDSLVYNHIPLGTLWSSALITYSSSAVYMGRGALLCSCFYLYFLLFMNPMWVQLKWFICLVLCVMYGFSQSFEFANWRFHSFPYNSTVDPLTRGHQFTFKWSLYRIYSTKCTWFCTVVVSCCLFVT